MPITIFNVQEKLQKKIQRFLEAFLSKNLKNINFIKLHGDYKMQNYRRPRVRGGANGEKKGKRDLQETRLKNYALSLAQKLEIQLNGLVRPLVES